MKKLLTTSILVFTFCFCAFAQTTNTAPCPTISVNGPTGIPKPNEPINFSAAVDNKEKDLAVEYVWSASHGKIIEGQGTQNIKVVFQPSDGSLTVTVEARGFPADCSNTASESLTGDSAPQAEKIEEFLQAFSRIDKNRIAEIVRSLQNDPTAQLYIIFKHKEKTSPKMVNQKEREISNSLVKAGLAADRITSITAYGQIETVEFWLVPAGATAPKIKGN